MKKVILVALLVMGFSTYAMADQDIGCGLGTILWKGKEGLVFKVLGATTNGTCGNQTFGITTGTLGCSQEGAIESRAQIQMFIAANMDRLAKEMAAGEGESLTALANLYGMSDLEKPGFYQMTQQNYETVFSSENVTAEQVRTSIDGLLGVQAG